MRDGQDHDEAPDPTRNHLVDAINRLAAAIEKRSRTPEEIKRDDLRERMGLRPVQEAGGLLNTHDEGPE